MWPAAECSALAHREPSGTHPRDRLPILWVSLAQSPSLKVDPTFASTPTKSLTVTKAKWSRSGAPASSPTAGENSGQGSLLRRASLSLSWEMRISPNVGDATACLRRVESDGEPS